MEETQKSLKYYFILIGIFGLSNITSLSAFNEDIILGVIHVIVMIFGIIFIGMGFKLAKLLKESPKMIINFLWVNLALSVIYALYSFYKGLLIGMNALVLIIAFTITLYLIQNVKRLSKGTKEAPSQYSQS